MPASQADVEALDEQILLARHRIAALLGEGPDRGLDIAAPTAESVKPFGLPSNLAAQSASAVAPTLSPRDCARKPPPSASTSRTADFYPNVTLNAYIGQQALGLSQLFKPAASIGQIGPAISLPIFEGGRLQGHIAAHAPTMTAPSPPTT